MKPFPYTKEGYRDAKFYLQVVKRYQDIQKELSTDGFTLITMANEHIRRIEKEWEEREKKSRRPDE